MAGPYEGATPFELPREGVRPLQKKTEDERIEEFVAQLRERTDLDDDALEEIGNAKNFNTAQFLALTDYELPERDLNSVVFAMKGPLFDENLKPITSTSAWQQYKEPQTIGEKDLSATYTTPEGVPLNVMAEIDEETGETTGGHMINGVLIPDQEVLDQYDMTPEEWAELPEETRALIDEATAGLDADEEDTRNYLSLFGEDALGYTDIISAPGYTFTYGEGLTATSTAYMRSHTTENPTMYVAGDEVAKWSGYSARMRNSFTEAMIKAGMISEEDAEGLTTGDLGTAYGQRPDGAVGYSGTSRVQIDAFKEALATANYLGTTPMGAIFARGETAKANPPGGGGGGRAAFSIPAQFRTIPDYETLQQRTKQMLRQTMGRDPEDWEMNLLADEMRVQHKSYNEKMIQASREAYNRGQHTVDIEVPDPKDRTQKFFEETYAGEIDRRRDIGEASATNMLMMNAMTKGSGMVE